MIQPGEKAPNLTLKNVEGQAVALADTWQQQPTLLVFLRHLGWLPCREHVAQLRSQQEEFKKLNANVVIITFGSAYLAKNWIKETQAPFLVLIDEERAAYEAYGLERSLLRSWGIKTFWRYAQLLLSGRRWRGIQGDSGQLGGNFIVDTQGILRLVHPSQNPTDRPPISDLLQIFEQLQ